MKISFIIAISCVILGIVSGDQEAYFILPGDLSVGVSTAAYQVEGAWNVSGKGESTWDHYTHNNPMVTLDHSNGDIATDSYHKYKEDVQLMKSLGVQSYRFSIAWSRVLPTGLTNDISEEGLQYYKNLIAELEANDIEPIVTLYHWDHPQMLEDMGGWTNEMMVDEFVAFAKVIFEELGDSVKMWATINEPSLYCSLSYEKTTPMPMAPGKGLHNIGGYLCVHNMLKAHAKVYHLYDDEFRPTQKGQIGIINACKAHLSAESIDTLSETAFQFNYGWIAHPIYIGDYPEIMKERIAMISKAEGYSESRLPVFSEEWISYIKGTSDYMGITHYSSLIVSPDPDEELGKYNTDMGLIKTVDPSWTTSPTAEWINSYAPGFGDILRKIRNEYNNPPVWVMGNGWSDDGKLEDYDRITYLHDYLRELLIAKEKDGCNIKGYFIWSITDAFDWSRGYSSKYGLYSVDFNDPDRKRTPKLSASWLNEVLQTRVLQPIPVGDEL